MSPSLAIVEAEGRKQKASQREAEKKEEENDDSREEIKTLKECQTGKLSKVTFNWER